MIIVFTFENNRLYPPTRQSLYRVKLRVGPVMPLVYIYKIKYMKYMCVGTAGENAENQ